MFHDEGLLRAIGEKPEDDDLRLVYADWLEEHDQPEFAEFVRVQVALHRNADGRGDLSLRDDARLHAVERRLRSKHEAAWLAPFRDLGATTNLHGTFSRGFFDSPTIDAAVFLERGEELFRLSPLVSLGLRKVGRLAKRLSRCPLLAKVRGLAFYGIDAVTPAGLRVLLGSEHLAGLRKLSLGGVSLGDGDLTALAALPDLPALEELSLSDARLTGAGLVALLGRFPSLRSLGLGGNKQLDPAGVAEALAALDGSSLRSLVFDRSPGAAVALRAAFAGGRFAELRELWLRSCGLDAASLTALAAAAHLTAVETLFIGCEALPEDGVAALSSWPGLRSLRQLNIDNAGIGPRAAVALAGGLRPSRLHKLDLRSTGIGDEGAVALIEAGLAGLRNLNLTGNHLTERTAAALAAAPGLESLRMLQLRENALGDAGADTLRAAENLRPLRRLSVDGNGLSRDASVRLLKAFPNLHIFSNDGEFLSGETLLARLEGLAAEANGGSADAVAGERLVRAILDDPEDIRARENYGRHLRGVDSPWWIVICLQRPGYPAPEEVRQRWRGWFDAERDQWLAPLLPWATLFAEEESYDRGFLRKVRFHGPVPDAVADELARFPPLALLPVEVQRGEMTGEGAFQVLARSPHLGAYTSLSFKAASLAELTHVLESPNIGPLESLSLGPCGLGDEAARMIAASPAAATLRELVFGSPQAGGNRIGPDGIAVLAGLPALQSLGLAGCPVGDEGIACLPLGVTALDIRQAAVSDEGLCQLAEWDVEPSLRVLRVSGPHGEAAARALAGMAGLTELEATPSAEAAEVWATQGLEGVQRLRVAPTARLRERFGRRLEA